LSIAKQLIEELSRDEEARRMLVEELAAHIVVDKRVRYLMLAALVRDVATREYVRMEAEGIRRELRDEMDKVRGGFRDEMNRVRSELKSDIEGLRKDLLNLSDRVGKLEERMDRLEERMDSLEGRMDRLEERMDRLEERVSRLEERVSRVEAHILLFTRLFIAFNVPILVGVVGTLLIMLWRTLSGAPIP